MSSFQRVLQRYDEVNIRTKPSKVHDYSPTQVGLGHLLDYNEFRTTQETTTPSAVAFKLFDAWLGEAAGSRRVGRKLDESDAAGTLDAVLL